MARPSYPSDKQDQFMLRLPEGMRDRIKAAADENGRSMNAEIIKRLESTFDVFTSAEEVQSFADEIGRTNEWAADLANQIREQKADLRTALSFIRLMSPNKLSPADERKLENFLNEPKD